MEWKAFYGPVAHLGERYVRNVEVESSSLFRSTSGKLPLP